MWRKRRAGRTTWCGAVLEAARSSVARRLGVEIGAAVRHQSGMKKAPAGALAPWFEQADDQPMEVGDRRERYPSAEK